MDEFQSLVFRLNRSDVETAVREINDHYLHWDKVRFRPLPEGLTDRQLWYAVKMRRRIERQVLPLSFAAEEPKLWYTMPPKHFEWIHKLDQQGGGRIGASSGSLFGDENERYLLSSLMEEAIASSQLEGASSTRRIAKAMLRAQRKPVNKDEKMILNNYKAILEVRELKHESLTPKLLCHLQKVLMEDLDDPEMMGRFRRADETIVVQTRDTNEVLHVPPVASELEWRIQQICDFANTISSPFVHPIVKAAVLHFAIGYVHPFVDGNGRTARAIFYWFMLKSDYWVFEYFPISRVLARAPAQYARAYLRTESDEGDVTYFIRYHLTVVLAAMHDFYSYVARQQREMKEAVAMLEAFPGLNHRQRSFVQDAIKNPDVSCTIAVHQGKYHVSYPTAHSDLLGLVELGLLKATKHGKTLLFHAADDLKKRLDLPPISAAREKPINQKSIAVTRRVASAQLALPRVEPDESAQIAEPDRSQKSLFD
ncbi:MAG: Fic family protein [Gemmataceae bacterium]